MRPAIQLHTLRNLDEPLDHTLGRVADTAFEGVQFTAGTHERSADEVAATLGETGLDVAGAHVALDTLRDDEERERVLDFYGALSVPDLVLPNYDREAFESAAGIEAAAGEIRELVDLVGEGVRLHYHNHYFEFTDLDGRTGFEAFADATAGALALEIDTGLAYHGGGDPAALIDAYADRVSLIHLTDTVPGSSETAHTDLGDGEVDLQGCVDAAARADVEWVIYENGLTDEPVASMEHAAGEVTRLIEAAGE